MGLLPVAKPASMKSILWKIPISRKSVLNEMNRKTAPYAVLKTLQPKKCHVERSETSLFRKKDRFFGRYAPSE